MIHVGDLHTERPLSDVQFIVVNGHELPEPKMARAGTYQPVYVIPLRTTSMVGRDDKPLRLRRAVALMKEYGK
jgi:hypothetical protein